MGSSGMAKLGVDKLARQLFPRQSRLCMRACVCVSVSFCVCICGVCASQGQGRLIAVSCACASLQVSSCVRECVRVRSRCRFKTLRERRFPHDKVSNVYFRSLSLLCFLSKGNEF